MHPFLLKQLKRCNLSEDTLPTEHTQWHDLLSRISRCYEDAESERYLLERSMEISSREFQELTSKLAIAQKIAQMGYWLYDRQEDKVHWSDELFHMMKLNPLKGPPTINDILAMMHPDDKPTLEKHIERAFSEGSGYEMELRIIDNKGEMRWQYIKARPHVNLNYNNEAVEDPTALRYLSGITQDITTRKEIEFEMKKLQQQLLDSARISGMGEVASSILHNIGNVMNSAVVSLSMLREANSLQYFEKLIYVSESIKNHLSPGDSYLTTDPKGKLLPEYLVALAKSLTDEYKNTKEEFENLNNHCNHIRDIMAAQKNISIAEGMAEKIFLPEIIEIALQIGCPTPTAKANQIDIVKNYSSTPFITVDKAKLMQILINLIRNAKESLISSSHISEKRITASVSVENNHCYIFIEDNGTGISEENFTKIFSFGFTTKHDGHGFGLHSSAIAAKQLNGNLIVTSKGINQGAKFTIEIPSASNDVERKNVL